MSSETFSQRLQKRLNDFSDSKIERLLGLLQQDRKGDIQALSDDQIQKIYNHVDIEADEFEVTEEEMEKIVERLRSEEYLSEIHRFDVKQIVDWVVTLDDEDFEDMLDALVPVFVDTFPNFVEALTPDQLSEAWPLLWPRVLKHFKRTKNLSAVLTDLYSDAQIGKAIKILKSEKSDKGEKTERRKRRSRRKERSERSERSEQSERSKVDPLDDGPEPKVHEESFADHEEEDGDVEDEEAEEIMD